MAMPRVGRVLYGTAGAVGAIAGVFFWIVQGAPIWAAGVLGLCVTYLAAGVLVIGYDMWKSHRIR